MPKQKITREMVIEAAFDIARREGMEKVIVKNIADKLGCSVQPIYSYCSNMEGLKAALTERTGTFMKEYLAAHIEKKDYFRSMGRAQLRFAREEPQLFQLYFLRRRSDIHSLQELYSKESSRGCKIYIRYAAAYHGAGGTAASAYDNLHNGNRVNSGDLLLPHSG